MAQKTADMADTDVIAPNFKRRLSGVTSTIVQLVPVQRRLGMGIAALGAGLPDQVAQLPWKAITGLARRPEGRKFRIWHARRNTEMLAGIMLRDVFHLPLRLVFTSAAQRHHKPFTKWLITRMDRVAATSSRSGSYLEVPHHVILHGIDLERFHPPDDKARAFAETGLPGRHAIGCFGRIRHQKGTDLFVDAMITLLPDHPEWTAVISGRVTAEHQGFAGDLKNRIARAGLSERIVFIGEVDDIRPWYRTISLLVAPSRNEGFGLTPLEAMASGVAAVTSDAGAYPDLVKTGQTGTTVTAGDGAALTEAIRPYLADPDLARKQGKTALAHARAHFAIEREALALNTLYEELWAEKE